MRLEERYKGVLQWFEENVPQPQTEGLTPPPGICLRTAEEEGLRAASTNPSCSTAVSCRYTASSCSAGNSLLSGSEAPCILLSGTYCCPSICMQCCRRISVLCKLCSHPVFPSFCPVSFFIIYFFPAKSSHRLPC